MLKSLSHLTRGAWIEIKELMEKDAENKSHLTRGAWIEIMVDITSLNFDTSHLTRGAWIETACRTSHEVRGLKFKGAGHTAAAERSHLTRGAWIEMLLFRIC